MPEAKSSAAAGIRSSGGPPVVGRGAAPVPAAVAWSCYTDATVPSSSAPPPKRSQAMRSPSGSSLYMSRPLGCAFKIAWGASWVAKCEQSRSPVWARAAGGKISTATRAAAAKYIILFTITSFAPFWVFSLTAYVQNLLCIL